MTTNQIIEHYAGYVEILISEGTKFTLEEAINYALAMFKEDTSRWKELRSNRFIGLAKLKQELKKRFMEMNIQ